MLAALASFWLQAGLSPFVFSPPAGRLENLIPELGQAIGKPLKAGAFVRDDVMLIHVSRLSQNEVLDRIAALEHASWVNTSDGTILKRTAAQDREMLSASRDRKLARIRADLKTRAENLSSSFTPDDARKVIQAADSYYRQYDLTKNGSSGNPEADNQRNLKRLSDWQQIEAMGPASQCIERCACLLNPETYVDLGSDEQIVFSSNPTQLQQQIPSEVLSTLKQLVAANNEIFDERKQEGGAPKVPSEWSWDPSRPEQHVDPDLCLYELTVAQEHNLPSSYTLSVSVQYHEKMVAWASTRTGFDIDSSQPPCMSSDVPCRQSEGGKQGLAIVTDKVDGKAILTDPVKNDPESLMAGPDLSQMADDLDRDVIARLPDSTFMGASILRINPKLSIGGMLTRMLGYFCEVQEDDRSITVSPSDEASYRVRQTDRRALAKLLQAAAKDGFVSIDSLAQFSLSNDPAAFEFVLPYCMGGILPGAQSVIRSADVPALKLYGSLSANERDQILAGRPLRASDLDPEADQQFQRMTYVLHPHIALTMQSDVDNFAEHLSTTATRLYPEGLPSTAALSAKVGSEAVLLASYEFHGSTNRTVQSIASIASGRDLALYQGRQLSSLTSALKYVVGRRTRITLQLTLDGKKMENHYLDEVKVDWRGAGVPYDSLPSDLLAEITKQTNLMQKSRHAAGIANSPGASP
jgi:hypothetical protein